jgi:hypothetical protein
LTKFLYRLSLQFGTIYA